MRARSDSFSFAEAFMSSKGYDKRGGFGNARGGKRGERGCPKTDKAPWGNAKVSIPTEQVS